MSEVTQKFAVAYPGTNVPADITQPHPLLVRGQYTVVAKGGALVPDATAAAQTITVSVGAIATEVTGFVLENHTGQDLLVSLNSEAAPTWSMPDGAVLAYQTPAGAATPITTIQVITTATQVGDRRVEATVFGA